MKSTPLFISLCLLVLVPPARAQDFRGIPWGTPLHEVAELNDRPFQKSADPKGQCDAVYTVLGTADGRDVLIGFYELEGQLVQGAYSFLVDQTEDNHIEEYEAIKKLMTARYGTPYEDVMEWKNEQYRDEPEQWGIAIRLGHLVLHTTWNTPKSQIKMGLVGHEQSILHLVYYYSPAFMVRFSGFKASGTP